MNINNIKTGLIKIPGALTSTGGDGNGLVGGVVAYTGDVYDVTLGKNQATINDNFAETLSRVNDDISDVQEDISELATIATSGSFNDLTDVPFNVLTYSYYKAFELNGLWQVSFGLNNQVNRFGTNAFGNNLTLDYSGTAVGEYNHPTNYVHFTVGTGRNNSSRRNGFVVDTAGNIYAYGINGYDGTNVISPETGQYSLTQFVNNLDSRATSLLNTINASSIAWSNLAPATNVTLAAITGLNATNAQDAFSEINTVIAPLRSGTVDSSIVHDGNFNMSQDEINLSVPYDISAAKNLSYPNLTSALGADGDNIPQNIRCGGMSIKFFNSTTNKYEIWNLISSSWSADVTNWKNPTEADSINYNGHPLPDTLNLIGKLSVNESNIVLSFLGKSFTLIENRDVQPPSSQTSAICGQAMCGKTICGLII